MKAVVKRIGNEIAVSCTPYRQRPKKRKPKDPDKERTPQAIAAAKSRIHEIVTCNDWEWTVTLEFSPKVLRAFGGDDMAIQKMKQWFANLKKRAPGFENLAWLLVPEPYIDRRKKLHLHGFLRGIPQRDLSLWQNVKGRKPAMILAKIKEGRKVYTWPVYMQKFGFCLLECIDGADIFKWERYVKKSLVGARHYRASGQHLYYCSRGLQRAEIVVKGNLAACGERYIQANAEKAYAHHSEPGQPIYGYTYILDDNAALTQKIKKIIIGEE